MGTFGTNRIYTVGRVVKVWDRMRSGFAPAWVRFPPYLNAKFITKSVPWEGTWVCESMNTWEHLSLWCIPHSRTADCSAGSESLTRNPIHAGPWPGVGRNYAVRVLPCQTMTSGLHGQVNAHTQTRLQGRKIVMNFALRYGGNRTHASLWWEHSVPIVYTRLAEWLRSETVWDRGLFLRGFDSLRISLQNSSQIQFPERGRESAGLRTRGSICFCGVYVMGTFGTNHTYTVGRVVQVWDRMRSGFTRAWVRFPPYLNSKFITLSHDTKMIWEPS